MDRERRRVGIRWKIGGAFAGLVSVMSVLLAFAVQRLTTATLTEQFDKRAAAVAGNLADAAAGPLTARNVLALHALSRKYTLLEGVAYAVIRDGQGRIAAHTFGTLPRNLASMPVGEQERRPGHRELVVEGTRVHEAIAPILEGQAGAVQVGFAAEILDQDIRRALLPLLAAIAAFASLTALLSLLAASWIVRPLTSLASVAGRITRGDLDASVGAAGIRSRDEIGELARALERMRSSLRAAMLRLSGEGKRERFHKEADPWDPLESRF